jgi:phosphatidylglycerophosphatase A
MSEPTPNLPKTMNSGKRKPRVSLAIATAFGLGYLPEAPGTFGSLGGAVLAIFPLWLNIIATVAGASAVFDSNSGEYPVNIDSVIFFQIQVTVVVALIGVWTAHRSANYWNIKDPQRVVIDEVSGQHLALLLGGFWPLRTSPASIFWINESTLQVPLWGNHPLGTSMLVSLNWKYLLLGFILFRVFDIWKPFPARQAESLPGGLGIMADDWIAGIYAALGLWIARAIGL